MHENERAPKNNSSQVFAFVFGAPEIPQSFDCDATNDLLKKIEKNVFSIMHIAHLKVVVLKEP